MQLNHLTFPGHATGHVLEVNTGRIGDQSLKSTVSRPEPGPGSPEASAVIVGGAGFIGRGLLEDLAALPHWRIRLLVHRRLIDKSLPGRIETVTGDLLEPSSLIPLMEEGCTVINLSYLADSTQAENLAAMSNLAEACRQGGARRLIHCSTAVVAGQTGPGTVDESTPCVPVSDYERVKYEIEGLLLSKAEKGFEVTILRPTAVFGRGGRNLLKLAGELSRGKVISNYFKSCLFSCRNMHLVCRENVVAALIFLMNIERGVNGQVFIISDDESPFNNYREVKTRLRVRLGMPSQLLPVIPLPLTFLRLLLWLVGRSTPDPGVKFSCAKIERLGFRKPQDLAEGLDAFGDWYRCQALRRMAKKT